MNSSELKKRAFAAIDESAQQIYTLSRELLAVPELGYKEVQTSKIVRRELESAGLTVSNCAITGLTAKAGKAGPCVCIMGELDALLHPTHKFADKKSGAAHACGHHAQLAMLVATAIALCKTGIINELSGSVLFAATPAEELIDLEYRDNLREKGLIKYFGGKPEMLHLGAFSGVDMALGMHACGDAPCTVRFGERWNGALAKRIKFCGKASHAGGAPEDGINALYAATAALSLINAQRETFRSEDFVRVHPIITKGGDTVSIIPDDVRVETFVRAKTVEAMKSTSLRVDAAAVGAAYAMGAVAEIKNLSGYLPFLPSGELMNLFGDEARELLGSDKVRREAEKVNCASTDAGDLSCIMPTIYPLFGGFSGPMHGADFTSLDDYSSYILPAKLICATIIELLAQNGAKAAAIKNNFTPIYKNIAEFERAWAEMLTVLPLDK